MEIRGGKDRMLLRSVTNVQKDMASRTLAFNLGGTAGLIMQRPMTSMVPLQHAKVIKGEYWPMMYTKSQVKFSWISIEKQCI